MAKQLVTIELRYSKVVDSDERQVSKTTTIGVYDTFEEACIEGNKLMQELERKFSLHVFPSGRTAKRERFSKNGGAFKSKQSLISNLAYLNTPFDFYAKISTLNYDNINDVINEAAKEVKNYRKFIKQ